MLVFPMFPYVVPMLDVSVPYVSLCCPPMLDVSVPYVSLCFPMWPYVVPMLDVSAPYVVPVPMLSPC